MATSVNNALPVVKAPAKLAHIVLRSSNLKDMGQFYQTFLGAKVTFENDVACFVTYDDEHHRIGIIAVPGLTPKIPKSAGLDHIAFTYDDINGLLEAYSQRKLHGIEPVWCVNHGPTISMYYRDPDGNLVETQVDVFDNLEQAAAFITSPEFIENPVGVDYDPEDFIKRLKGGESTAGIYSRPNIGPRGFETSPLE